MKPKKIARAAKYLEEQGMKNPMIAVWAGEIPVFKVIVGCFYRYVATDGKHHIVAESLVTAKHLAATWDREGYGDDPKLQYLLESIVMRLKYAEDLAWELNTATLTFSPAVRQAKSVYNIIHDALVLAKRALKEDAGD